MKWLSAMARERRDAFIVAEYKNNISIKAIARALNVSKSTVQKVLRKNRESFKVGSELNESK